MSYKYFKPNEIISLDPELCAMLDEARGHAGVRFVITSGYRTKEKNEEVGGTENSSHLLGLAVDIACTESQERLRIIIGLILAGFKRIGIARDHVHCDIDREKAQEVLFLEYA